MVGPTCANPAFFNALDSATDSADVVGTSPTVRGAGAAVGAKANGVEARPGATATVAVRPENLRLTPATAPGPLTGRIAERLFKGAQTVATVRLPGGREVEALLDPATAGDLGEGDVTVGWDADRAVLIAD